MTTGSVSHIAADGVPARMLPAFDNRKIYPGALLTSFQSIFQYAIHHGLRATATLNVACPQKGRVLKSVYKLKKFFIRDFSESQSIQHWYCSFCQRPLPTHDAMCAGRECSSESPEVFIMIPTGPK